MAETYLHPSVACRAFRAGHEPRAALGLGGRGRALHLEPANGPRLRPSARASVQFLGAARLARCRRPLRAHLSAHQARLCGAARLSRAEGRDADDLRHRAGGARGRHRRLGRRALLRHAGLVAAPPRQPDHAHGGGARLSRRADRGALPQAQRLAHPPRAARRPRGHLALRARAGLSRHAHLQGAWRPRLLGPGAVARSSARSPRAAPTASPSSWCRTRSGPAS